MALEDLTPLAVDLTSAQEAWGKAWRSYINTAKPEISREDFWAVLTEVPTEYFKHFKNAERRWGLGIAEHIVDEMFRRLLYDAHVTLGTAVSVFLMYEDFSRKLSKKMRDWEDLDRSDDSYNDLIDSLPLAGSEVVEGILDDDIANNKQLTKAVTKSVGEDAAKFILHGENYVRMAMGDYLSGAVARGLDRED